MQDLDPSLYGEADRRAVDPPIEVEAATWSAGGQLDWWVKERQQWLGRVRGPDRSGRLVRNDQTVLSRLAAVLEAPDPDFAIARGPG